LDSHWAWLLQLTHCLETRLNRTVRFQQFFAEAKEVESFITAKMKQINEFNQASKSEEISVDTARELMQNIAHMGEAIRGQSFIVDKLIGMADEIVDLVPPNNPNEPLSSICFFAPNSEPHYMELAPEDGDVEVVPWPSANFEKAERMTILTNSNPFTLKLRRSNGEELEAPAVCFLSVHPCQEAKTQAQDIVTHFQDLQVVWADAELSLHGRLLRATMRSLPKTLPSLSSGEKQRLMLIIELRYPESSVENSQLHEDTQRHLVGMRLANKPVDEIETFQQESNQCFQQLQNGNSVALKSDEIISSPTDLKRIETVLNALAEDLRRRNDLEWSRSVNQVKEHLERATSDPDKSTNENSGSSALLAAADELSTAGKATARRLAEVDVILTRLDSLQRELASAEQRVVDIAARIHSPRQNQLSGSRASLRSDVSEMETSIVEVVHDQLRNVTLSLSELRRLLEQLPHQLSALSTQGITTGSSVNKHRLLPPNTSLLEKSISAVNRRLENLVNQIDLMNKQLAETYQLYKSAITLRRGLTVWLRETSDVVESAEKSIQSYPHRNISTSAEARNLERSSTEAVHGEEKLKELNQTVENLTNLLEESASRGDTYKRVASGLPFATMETANTRFVGPPGIGIIDLVSLEASVANLNTQFSALKSRIDDNLAMIVNMIDGEEHHSIYGTAATHRTIENMRTLLSPACCTTRDLGDFFTISGSSRRKRRKASPSLNFEEIQAKRRPMKRKLMRYCVVSGFYFTSPNQSLRIETAITRAMIREGLVDVHNNLVYDSDSGAMITVGEALGKSVIVGLIITKSLVKRTGEKTYWLEIFHKRHDVYLIEGVYDVNAKVIVPVEDAIASKLLDPVRGLYHHTGIGETITLEDAHQQGLIRVVHHLRPPCEDLVSKPFDSIHYRTVEVDFAVCPLNVTFKEQEDIINQKDEDEVSKVKISAQRPKKRLPLDLHLMGNLTPVSMTDGTAISAIKLPLVRRLVPQNLPTLETSRRQLDSPQTLSLATALRRGWVDPRTGRLRSSTGAISQVNLFEAVEQRFLDPNSIVVRIGNGTDSGVSGNQHYTLATILDAANTIANRDSHISEASWRNELLKTLMIRNASPADGEVSESLSPDDYSRLQSVIAPKSSKGDKKLSATKIILKPKKKKIEEKICGEKLQGERLSLARIAQFGRFDPSTGMVLTTTNQKITLQEAIELEIVDGESSLIKDERTGHYHSLLSYLNDGTISMETWIEWPMATLLSSEEVESFGRRQLSIGRRIPYASAQTLHLIKPRSRTVLNPQTQAYVSILNAFTDGPLCRHRTLIHFRTTQEYIPVDILLPTNPENVITELLFDRSMCVELQEDLVDEDNRNRSVLHITVPSSVDSKQFATVSLPVDLKTAVQLGWLDPQIGFVNDPFTGHRLLIKEAIEAGLIDGEKTMIRDPATNKISTLNSILYNGDPINVPYLVHLSLLDDVNRPNLHSPVGDSSLATSSGISELPGERDSAGITPNKREVKEEKGLSEAEFPVELGKDLSSRSHEKDRDSGKLKSDLLDAASKVGTGLAVALGAAALGGNMAYQSIKDKIQSGKSSSLHKQASSGEYIQQSNHSADNIQNKSSYEIDRPSGRMDVDDVARPKPTGSARGHLHENIQSSGFGEDGVRERHSFSSERVNADDTARSITMETVGKPSKPPQIPLVDDWISQPPYKAENEEQIDVDKSELPDVNERRVRFSQSSVGNKSEVSIERDTLPVKDYDERSKFGHNQQLVYAPMSDFEKANDSRIKHLDTDLTQTSCYGKEPVVMDSNLPQNNTEKSEKSKFLSKYSPLDRKFEEDRDNSGESPPEEVLSKEVPNQRPIEDIITAARRGSAEEAQWSSADKQLFDAHESNACPTGSVSMDGKNSSITSADSERSLSKSVPSDQELERKKQTPEEYPRERTPLKEIIDEKPIKDVVTSPRRDSAAYPNVDFEGVFADKSVVDQGNKNKSAAELTKSGETLSMEEIKGSYQLALQDQNEMSPRSLIANEEGLSGLNSEKGAPYTLGHGEGDKGVESSAVQGRYLVPDIDVDISMRGDVDQLTTSAEQTSPVGAKGSGIKTILAGAGSNLAATLGAPLIAGVMAYNAIEEKLKSIGGTSDVQHESMVVDENSLKTRLKKETGESLGPITVDVSEEQQPQFRSPNTFFDSVTPESHPFDERGSKSSQQSGGGTLEDPNQAKSRTTESGKLDMEKRRLSLDKQGTQSGDLTAENDIPESQGDSFPFEINRTMVVESIGDGYTPETVLRGDLAGRVLPSKGESGKDCKQIGQLENEREKSIPKPRENGPYLSSGSGIQSGSLIKESFALQGNQMSSEPESSIPTSFSDITVLRDTNDSATDTEIYYSLNERPEHTPVQLPEIQAVNIERTRVAIPRPDLDKDILTPKHSPKIDDYIVVSPREHSATSPIEKVWPISSAEAADSAPIFGPTDEELNVIQSLGSDDASLYGMDTTDFGDLDYEFTHLEKVPQSPELFEAEKNLSKTRGESGKTSEAKPQLFTNSKTSIISLTNPVETKHIEPECRFPGHEESANSDDTTEEMVELGVTLDKEPYIEDYEMISSSEQRSDLESNQRNYVPGEFQADETTESIDDDVFERSIEESKLASTFPIEDSGSHILTGSVDDKKSILDSRQNEAQLIPEFLTGKHGVIAFSDRLQDKAISEQAKIISDENIQSEDDQLNVSPSDLHADLESEKSIIPVDEVVHGYEIESDKIALKGLKSLSRETPKKSMLPDDSNSALNFPGEADDRLPSSIQISFSSPRFAGQDVLDTNDEMKPYPIGFSGASMPPKQNEDEICKPKVKEPLKSDKLKRDENKREIENQTDKPRNSSKRKDDVHAIVAYLNPCLDDESKLLESFSMEKTGIHDDENVDKIITQLAESPYHSNISSSKEGEDIPYGASPEEIGARERSDSNELSYQEEYDTGTSDREGKPMDYSSPKYEILETKSGQVSEFSPPEVHGEPRDYSNLIQLADAKIKPYSTDELKVSMTGYSEESEGNSQTKGGAYQETGKEYSSDMRSSQSLTRGPIDKSERDRDFLGHYKSSDTEDAKIPRCLAEKNEVQSCLKQGQETRSPADISADEMMSGSIILDERVSHESQMIAYPSETMQAKDGLESKEGAEISALDPSEHPGKPVLNKEQITPQEDDLITYQVEYPQEIDKSLKKPNVEEISFCKMKSENSIDSDINETGIFRVRNFETQSDTGDTDLENVQEALNAKSLSDAHEIGIYSKPHKDHESLMLNNELSSKNPQSSEERSDVTDKRYLESQSHEVTDLQSDMDETFKVHKGESSELDHGIVSIIDPRLDIESPMNEYPIEGIQGKSRFISSRELAKFGISERKSSEKEKEDGNDSIHSGVAGDSSAVHQDFGSPKSTTSLDDSQGAGKNEMNPAYFPDSSIRSPDITESNARKSVLSYKVSISEADVVSDKRSSDKNLLQTVSDECNSVSLNVISHDESLKQESLESVPTADINANAKSSQMILISEPWGFESCYDHPSDKDKSLESLNNDSLALTANKSGADIVSLPKDEYATNGLENYDQIALLYPTDLDIRVKPTVAQISSSIPSLDTESFEKGIPASDANTSEKSEYDLKPDSSKCVDFPTAPQDDYDRASISTGPPEKLLENQHYSDIKKGLHVLNEGLRSVDIPDEFRSSEQTFPRVCADNDSVEKSLHPPKFATIGEELGSSERVRVDSGIPDNGIIGEKHDVLKQYDYDPESLDPLRQVILKSSTNDAVPVLPDSIITESLDGVKVELPATMQNNEEKSDIAESEKARQMSVLTDESNEDHVTSSKGNGTTKISDRSECFKVDKCAELVEFADIVLIEQTKSDLKNNEFIPHPEENDHLNESPSHQEALISDKPETTIHRKPTKDSYISEEIRSEDKNEALSLTSYEMGPTGESVAGKHISIDLSSELLEVCSHSDEEIGTEKNESKISETLKPKSQDDIASEVFPSEGVLSKHESNIAKMSMHEQKQETADESDEKLAISKFVSGLSRENSVNSNKKNQKSGNLLRERMEPSRLQKLAEDESKAESCKSEAEGTSHDSTA
uniref:SUN domain-containing protein n=5 Tax=Hymenolepis diminuta TaxID=6216 RepID=A0A158QDW4_HYMDI